jgi:plastocyanin
MKNLFGALAVAGFIAVGGCGGASASTSPTNTTGGGPTTGSPSTPATPTLTNAVGVSDDFFSPSSIQVSPGTTVTWTWASTAALHNVTFGDGVASATVGANATYSRTFATAGTFSYLCTLHGGMTGSVLVK